MKKLVFFLLPLLLAAALSLPALAAEGEVVYDGGAGEFIFLPGSSYSPTDLFPNYKDVMPGDSLTQNIQLRNDGARQVVVRVWMRALGAHPDSAEFLSQLHLQVELAGEALLFDAPAHETAQLTDWVYLGTLYPGGETELEVTLEVPVGLDSRFGNAVGYLDWEFAVEEFPVGSQPEPPQEGDAPGEPQPEPPREDQPDSPYTGDHSLTGLWTAVLCGALIGMAVTILLMVKERRKEQDGPQTPGRNGREGGETDV